MVPWVYEFHWTVFHITFLLVFFSVFVVILTTLFLAVRRTTAAERLRTFDAILWHSDFEDMPSKAKICRHELSGEIKNRVCDNGFDCGSCKVHALLAARKTATPPLQFEAYGFTMPPYRMYHRGHTWVQEEKDGTYKIGIDDFGTRVIGKPSAVELPPIGSRLSVNGNGMVVKKQDAKIRILSPIDGEVVEHGDTEKGWYLKVKTDDSEKTTAHLLNGSEVPNWIMREMERLQMSFATSGVGVTLADGGELVPDFHKHFPKADWDSVFGQIFLQA
jgi:glycine cleavage system H lipoate-binding protein